MRNELRDRCSTGIGGLDHILYGGLLPHQLYLIDGDPGAGKTTLAMQYVLRGREQGERCLYVTLSESADELRASAAAHGWNLDGIDVIELGRHEQDLAPDAQLTMYSLSEIELSETTKRVLDAVDQFNPTRVVFDSLSELRLLAQSPLRYRRQILGLKQFFVGRKCTVLLLDDRTSGDEDLQLASIVHGVIALEQLSPVYGAERRRLRVLKLRGSAYRGGYHDFVIQEGGIQLFPRLIAAEHQTEFQFAPIRSGVAALDALMGGGPDRGTSTLLLGPAGSGKSTIAVQYVVAATQRGDRAAMFLFDERPETLFARTKSMGIGLQEACDAGRVTIQQIDPAEISPGQFAHLVRQAVDRDGAGVVTIDSLNGYLSAMPEEHFLTIQLHEILTYLGRQGVTTFLVAAQHGIFGAIQSPVELSYLADSIVLLRYFEEFGMVKKAISVMKKRSGRHEDTIRELRFDARGIHLTEPLKHFSGVLTGTPILHASQHAFPEPKYGAAVDAIAGR